MKFAGRWCTVVPGNMTAIHEHKLGAFLARVRVGPLSVLIFKLANGTACCKREVDRSVGLSSAFL